MTSLEHAQAMRRLARAYHGFGLNVVPLDGEKRPVITGAATNGKPFRFRWSDWQAQRQTEDAFRAILRPSYWAAVRGVGAICGPVSGGLACVDFDSRRKSDPDAPAIPGDVPAGFLAALGLPADYAWTVRTPGGGWHVWLRCPDLALDAAKLDRPGVHPAVEHVELRYAGTYTALPGSEHPAGLYAWAGAEPAEPPAIVGGAALLAAYAAVTHAAAPPAAQPPASPGSSAGGDGSRYGRAALRGECETVREAAPGGRNDALNTAAFRLGQLVPHELTESAAEQALLEAALAAGLGEGEAMRTIRSGLRAGMVEPRYPAGGGGAQPTNGAGYAAGFASETPPDLEDADIDAETGEFLTDMGNGRRLARLYGQDLRWTYELGWLHWDGRAWTRDLTGEVMRRAKSVALGFYDDAQAAFDDARAKADQLRGARAAGDEERASNLEREIVALELRAKSRLKWASACQARARLDAMVALAASEPPIPVRSDDFDRDPWLLNVANGTLDLRSGDLRPHRREDLLTVAAPVAFDPAAECPTWERFLTRIMGEDGALISFLQRVVGYSLTGDVSEQKLFFAWGAGANGKSTFIGAVLDMLGGDYAAQAAPDLLVAGSQRHPTELADLRGKRLVASIEVDDGKRLAEGLVKQLTGGDRVKARLMRQDFFQFSPTHKLLLVANHKPAVRGVDHAIWRRICLIPFDVTIPEEQQDKQLPEKLRAEAPGILAWAVRGCLAWRRRGLDVPAAVRAATEQYRTESDTLGAFLEECTVAGDACQVMASELYKAYQAWCERSGERALSATTFGKRLAERGLDKYRQRRGYFYLGIALAESAG